MLSPNILGSKLTISERWIKLYRLLFNKFLKKDFVELEDYKMMFNQLNARITQLETAMNNSIMTTNNNIQSAIAMHTHMAPQAPAGVIQTMAGQMMGSIPQPPSSKIPEAPFVSTNMINKSIDYLSIGPALAPLGDGLSLEATKSTSQSISDIGLE
jgi:hypothetical protein